MQCQRTAFLLYMHDTLKQKRAELHYHSGKNPLMDIKHMVLEAV